MKRILVLKPFLLTKANGGEIALLERLKLFKSWGLSIKVVIALAESERAYVEPILSKFSAQNLRWETPAKASYTLEGIPCEITFSSQFHAFDTEFQSPVENFFRNEILSFQPDLVLTHFTDFFATAAALLWSTSRTWVDQTDDEYPRPAQLQNFPTLSKVYSSIEHFIVASNFMKESVSKHFPTAHLHYLPNIIEALSSSPTASYHPAAEAPWIFVNPTAVKGVDFVMALARELPTEKFLFVGNWNTTMPTHLPSNIQTVERQNDLLSLLRAAKGLLMPSVWNEAFGRMPLEAMAVGIPVIASNKGALPMTVGIGGICLPLDIALWKRALSQDVNTWQQLVIKGHQRVSDYKREVDHVYSALKRSWNL